MSKLNELYQEVILDHHSRPRNYYKLENANRNAEGYNPLCGDRVHVYLKLEGDLIQEISFEGTGCVISRASASLMTVSLKGKSKSEAEILFTQFHRLVTEGNGNFDLSELGKLAVFSGVSEFPVRVKCAILAWHTLRAALEGKDEKVITE